VQSNSEQKYFISGPQQATMGDVMWGKEQSKINLLLLVSN